MKDRKISNMAASVRQRLLNLARDRGEAFDYVLGRYGTERLLYRLSRSQYADQFILKGAILFQLWSKQPHRPTRDIDLLGSGDPSAERIAGILAELCQLEVDDDGLVFDSSTVVAEPIKREDEYQGIRAKVTAYLEQARVSLQVDCGFGDAVHPKPEEIEYPTLLDQAAPRLRAYPRETVVAEKLQATVMLGMANSRMKDFFDLWTLARGFSFDGRVLAEAIRATFERRRTEIPATVPIALTDEFAEDGAKAMQWSAFLKKGALEPTGLALSDVTSFLRKFLMPPVLALSTAEEFTQQWAPQGHWKPL